MTKNLKIKREIQENCNSVDKLLTKKQELDKIQNLIEAINNKENDIKSLTEADFKEKTFNFKKNAQNGRLWL